MVIRNAQHDGGGMGHGGHTGGDTGPAVSATAVDLSSSGMLVLNGAESADFLQRLSTNDFSAFASGAALQTVLTDEKGRIIDIVIAVHQGASILLVTSPDRSGTVKAWLEKFIIMEDIEIEDETGRRACVVVTGANEAVITSLTHAPLEMPVTIISFSYFSLPAVLFISSSASDLRPLLASHGIVVLTSEAWIDFRIVHGIPEIQRELTEKTNPLEAGLRGLVNFAKGCYIGQEVIARLNTYEKVQRSLCRIRLSARPPDKIGAELIGEEGVHGYITTLGRTAVGDGSVRALAMIKAASAVPGARFSLRDMNISAIIESIV